MSENLMFSPLPADAALSLFKQTAIQGWYHRLWANVTHRTSHLLELDDALCYADVTWNHSGGVRTACIDYIRGTAGKVDTFDAQFHPINETSRSRWMSIAREKMRGHKLPPVDLVDVEGIYYVRVGHHRISAARSLGQSFIEADVLVMKVNRRIM